METARRRDLEPLTEERIGTSGWGLGARRCLPELPEPGAGRESSTARARAAPTLHGGCEGRAGRRQRRELITHRRPAGRSTAGYRMHDASNAMQCKWSSS